MRVRDLIAAALLVAWSAQAALAINVTAPQPLALPAPPPAKIDQRPGAALPLDMPLRDEIGAPVRLGDYFHADRPVLLVLGYYRCPQLCGLLMHGLLEGLQGSGISRLDWRIVGVSIDPRDDPAAARARSELDFAYADFLLGAQSPAAPLDLHLLVASRADSQQLAAQVGFIYRAAGADAAPARFAHPGAVIVATPDGQVSRYLMGIQFDPADLRIALADAAGDRIGGVTGRIALLCAHFDPRVGRYSDAVMNTLRLLGAAMVVSLAGWCWHRRGSPGKAP
jgi:protein SCO1/2